jgi:hypothetical protein
MFTPPISPLPLYILCGLVRPSPTLLVWNKQSLSATQREERLRVRAGEMSHCH